MESHSEEGGMGVCCMVTPSARPATAAIVGNCGFTDEIAFEEKGDLMHRVSLCSFVTVSVVAVAAWMTAADKANATVYYEGFDSQSADINGWAGNGDEKIWLANGGVGNSGCFEQTSTAASGCNYYAMSTNAPANKITGNINSVYGPAIDFSFDYKRGASSGDVGLSVYIYSESAGAGNGGWWWKPLVDQGSLPTTWTHYGMEFNTTWSDTDAQAAGWAVYYGKPGTWAETMTSVSQVAITRNLNASSGVAPFDLYLDNVRMASTPEPTTSVLLAMGVFGFLAYAWRKRK
jgi:hypothetical protein